MFNAKNLYFFPKKKKTSCMYHLLSFILMKYHVWIVIFTQQGNIICVFLFFCFEISLFILINFRLL
jgi:hypothetical protein